MIAEQSTSPIKTHGMVIVFEGIDYSGKTTISKRVYDDLSELGYAVDWYRGPGGTQLGERMRDGLFSPGLKVEPSNNALMCAMMASHAQLIDEVLVPRKAEGRIIILDRFVESTMSYQGRTPVMREVIDRMIGAFTPVGLITKTYILDVETETMVERKKGRGIDNFLDTKEISFYEENRKNLRNRALELKRRGEHVDIIPNNTNDPTQILNYILGEIVAAQETMTRHPFSPSSFQPRPQDDGCGTLVL